MAILLLPLVTLLIPIVRLVPPLVTWRMQARVYRRYAQLAEVERRFANGDEGDRGAARQELERIDREVSALRVPVAYSYFVYRLRSHLDLVRERMTRQPVRPPPST